MKSMSAVKKVKIVLLALGAVALAVVGFHATLPASWYLERSTQIDVPPERIFPLVNDLKQQESWSPWRMQDPTMTNQYSPQSAGEGAWCKWTGQHSGNGVMTVIKSVPNQEVEVKLEFDGHGNAIAGYKIVANEQGAGVTWWFKGKEDGFGSRFFGAMLDTFLGPQYELGLANLKGIAEGTGVPTPEPG